MKLKLLKWAMIVLNIFVVIGFFLIYQFGPIVGAQFGKSIYMFPQTGNNMLKLFYKKFKKILT